MLIQRFVIGGLFVAALILAASMVLGQEYPTKPIRIIVTEAGGGGDFVARLIGPGLTSALGQPVIVDNRPGGVLPRQIVAKAPPDGYTLLGSASILWLGPFLEDTPYDPVRDFSPITLAVKQPLVLVTHPSLPVKSVRELIAFAKARPGELNIATGGTGGTPHLAAELFKSMAGINIVRIPYKGQATALTDLIGGQVHLNFGLPGSVMPHVKSGKLRALAVTSTQPSALVPGLPTVAAALPGYESGLIYGIFAPAKTPAAIINRLNQEAVRVLNRADMREKFLDASLEVVASSPKELADAVSLDMARMGKVIKDAGIRAE
jgi:tripartite-type tricarboxylate transporter receptor subunit TctC